MPYIVQELIEDNPPLVTVSLQEPISAALIKMIEHDFSQLPIVDSDNKPQGLVTAESILRSLNHFGVGLDQLTVQDARVKAHEFRNDADMFELLDRLRDTYAVVIVDGEGCLMGIVTNFDTADYFRRRAEDMMLVEDIETMLKDYIQVMYTTDQDEVDEKKLAEAIQQITDSGQAQRSKFEKALIHYLTLQSNDNTGKPNQEWLDQVLAKHFRDSQPSRTFDDLNLSEYIDLLLDKKRWNRNKNIFTLDRIAIRNLLDKVRETRNALAHFRSEITLVQRKQLRFSAEWLAQYQEKFNALSGVKTELSLPTGQEQEENLTTEAVGSSQIIESSAVKPVEDEPDPRESRYAPLAIWLQSQPADIIDVTLSFLDVAEIIGGDLPGSAYIHRAWWANDSVGHVQSQQWLDIGWRVASINMTEQRVRFGRIKERQRAYIDFFSNLLTKLSKQEDFSYLKPNPDGVSWYLIKSVNVYDRGIASFNYSFGRGGIFRVELYIDTGEREVNKQIFDKINAQKQEIHQQLDATLSWQRLNERRACRVAWIFQGHITDNPDELAKLREKVVPAMITFIEIMQPFVEEATKEVLQK